MTTCRIEIEGIYNNMCGAQDITISRTQPAAMTAHMMPQSWDAFCDRIDDALRPLSKYRKISQWMSILYLFVFFGVFIYFFIGGAAATTATGSGGIGFMALFVVLFGLFFILFAIQCYGMSKARTAIHKIQEICSEVSAQHPNLSFHSQMNNIFYRRRYYGYYEPPGIQVSITNPQAYIASPYDTTVGVGTGGIVEATAVVATPAERLSQLDQMKEKHLITEEEYNNKRNEILESV